MIGMVRDKSLAQASEAVKYVSPKQIQFQVEAKRISQSGSLNTPTQIVNRIAKAWNLRTSLVPER